MDKICLEIYEKIFSNIQQGNIDVFLCGRATDSEKPSYRDKIRDILKDDKSISILYPEDLFTEMLNKKKYDLLTLEKFLANNSDLIVIVCVWSKISGDPNERYALWWIPAISLNCIKSWEELITAPPIDLLYAVEPEAVETHNPLPLNTSNCSLLI